MDEHYDSHDPDECYTCDGTGEVEFNDEDGILRADCECPCHEPGRDPVGRAREAAAQDALGHDGNGE